MKLLDLKTSPTSTADVVLYGFGRIGRIARLLVDEAGGGDVLRLRAIVPVKEKVMMILRKELRCLEQILFMDLSKELFVLARPKYFFVNVIMQIIYANSPSEIDYTEFDIKNAIIVIIQV